MKLTVQIALIITILGGLFLTNPKGTIAASCTAKHFCFGSSVFGYEYCWCSIQEKCGEGYKEVTDEDTCNCTCKSLSEPDEPADSGTCKVQMIGACVVIPPGCPKGLTAVYDESCTTCDCKKPSAGNCTAVGLGPICFVLAPHGCAYDQEPVTSTNGLTCDCTCQPVSAEGDKGGVFCDDRGYYVNTAFGCLPTDAKRFASWIVSRLMIIGGGVAFLLMLYGAFQIITSSGHPEGIQAGKELFTAAISGLLLIIFAIYILRLVGVQILGIPGL
ncbi:MAG TPA: pilin [Candidatus Bathyarchaeia archaeon]|nr:pilin [Candidatus Bathyarchaeia archaeon]